jgi:hypothetical protein
LYAAHCNMCRGELAPCLALDAAAVASGAVKEPVCNGPFHWLTDGREKARPQ